MDATTRRRGAGLRTHSIAIGAALAVALGGWGFARASTPAPAALYQAITPCRLVDTRPAPDTVGLRATALGPADTFTVDGWGAHGNCDLPAGSSALAANVTAVDASALTYLTFFPAGAERPKASSLNPYPGSPPTPNAVNITLAADGRFSVFNLAGSVGLIVDVVGVYAAPIRAEQSVTIDAYTGFTVSTSNAAQPRDVNNSYCVRATPVTGSAFGLWASASLPAGSVVTSLTVDTMSATAQPYTLTASTTGAAGRSIVTSGAQPLSSGPGRTAHTFAIDSQTPIVDGEAVRMFFHSWVSTSTAYVCSVTIRYSLPG